MIEEIGRLRRVARMNPHVSKFSQNCEEIRNKSLQLSMRCLVSPNEQHKQSLKIGFNPAGGHVKWTKNTPSCKIIRNLKFFAVASIFFSEKVAHKEYLCQIAYLYHKNAPTCSIKTDIAAEHSGQLGFSRIRAL